jgi:N-acetylglucosaminyl-diphospho-decaprenol L-rhamnosyltransferase
MPAAETAGPASPSPAVTVVVVNFNSGPYLARCLEALKVQRFRDFCVVVVDNGSSDESREALANLPEGWQAVHLDCNRGFAAANNIAVAASRSPWVAILNPDAFADPDWLAQAMGAVQRYPDAAAFGSQQIDAARPDRLDGAGDAYHVSGLYWRGGFGQPLAHRCLEGEVLSPCAAAAFYRRDTFMALGGFDEGFFCFGEDVDLGFRLRLAGHRSIQLANAVVRHVGGGSGGGQSRFARYHGVRNRLWLFVKDMPPALFWPMAPVHLLLTLLLMLQSTVRGEIGAFLGGLFAGIAGLGDAWRKRREIQSRRTGNVLPLLCWSPFAAIQRRPIVRPVPGHAPLKLATGKGGIGVVMVSYRTGPVLFAALDAALADATVERVVLVDNGNEADTRAELARRALLEPRLKIVEGQANIGFAAGCNLAARHVESDHLLILNPDCIMPAGAGEIFRAELMRRTSPALLGAMMVDASGREQRATRRNLPTPTNLLGEALRLDRLISAWPRIEMLGVLPEATIAIPAISGAAMFLTLANYWALGGLDGGYFLHVEDLDFCNRFRGAGGEVCLMPGLRIRHARSSSEAARPLIEWHKAVGFRRYFLKQGMPAWQRALLDLAIFSRFALVAIGSFGRRRGSASGSGVATALPDRS